MTKSVYRAQPVIGHKKQLEFLRRIVESKKIPHAFLFSGQEKLGKKKIALEFSKLVFNQSPFLHPDFIFLEPEKDQIPISQIRDLIWRLSLKPALAQFKIAIIDKAHLMPKDSQNCLLKTLEEPKNSILILITEYPELLLPTIVSRCEVLKFYPVPKKEIEEYLKNNNFLEIEIKEISNITLGRPGVIFDFISNPEKLKNHKNKMRKFNEIFNQNLPYHFQYAKELSGDPELGETLKLMLFYFRKLLLEKVEKKSNLNSAKIRDILDSIQSTYFLISNTNINKRLALEILMLKF